jgi:erythromycin esterase-like protein
MKSDESISGVLTSGALLKAAVPWYSEEADRAFLTLVGDADIVLLGEASHGTHEFYSERARLTRMLIEKKDFMAVAVEADWPDSYQSLRPRVRP